MSESREKQMEARKIFVKGDFFELIKSGRKTAELRIAFPDFADIAAGEKINFSSGSGEEISVEVTGVRFYDSIAEVRSAEDLTKLAPGLTEKQLDIKAKQLFDSSKVQEHGLMVFEFIKSN